MYIFKGPYVKSKIFCPNPVVRHGVPLYADSIRSPKVWGTMAWQEWWEDQIRRCIVGYNTGGMFIPGKYYKFLNFDLVTTVGKGNHYPDFIDFQYDFFSLVEEAKRLKQGILSLKARRKGLSEMVCSVMDSGYRFRTGYQAGVCAGLSEHEEGFIAKFNRGINLKPAELRIRTLHDKQGSIMAGWKEKENGQWIEKGSRNTILHETMYENPNVFKGKFFDDAVFEEAGEFKLLEQGYNATQPCFKDGELMVGTPYIFGTGGNMTRDSKAFAEMWHDATSMRLMKFFVSAKKMYFPCVANYIDGEGKLQEDIPYLKAQYKDFERIGMSDEKRAEEMILAERKILKQKKNKQTYHDHLQNYPLNEKESFLKFSGNNFDSLILSENLYNLSAKPKQYGLYTLDWVRDEKGVLVHPLKVRANPLNIDDAALIDMEDQNYVMIHRMPLPQIKNLDCAGIDSYDMDKSNVSKSLGAMVVYRRDHDIPGIDRRLPVCMIRCRPSRKENFYEMCMKVSVFYGLEGNTLVGAENPLIIEYYINHSCERFLAERPVEFDSPDSRQSHKFGVKVQGGTKPKMLGVIQTEIIDHSQKWPFPQLLEGCLDYDTTQKDSDWDEVDALGIAKIRDIDMHRTHRIQDPGKKEEVDPYLMAEWVEMPDGSWRDISTQKHINEEIKDPFLRMIASQNFNK